MADLRLQTAVPSSLPTNLPVLSLRRGVLLPASRQAFLVGRKSSVTALDAADGFLLVATQREPVSSPAPSDLLPTAVLARVVSREEAKGAPAERAVLEGIARVHLTGFARVSPYFEASYSVIDEVWPEDLESAGMWKAFREQVENSAEQLGRGLVAMALALPPHRAVDAIASGTKAARGWAEVMLTTHDPVARAESVVGQLVRLEEVAAAKGSIQERVQNATRGQQKDFLLRQQLKAIQEELGEGGDTDDLARLRERLDERELPEEVREVVDRELRRLERLSSASPERTVAIDWLEWVADMPWALHSGVDDVDLTSLEAALDKSHHGLEKVKQQVVEHLAVRKLAGSGRAEVLLLAGPPGVGKTSIGQAIADATGRKLVRVALGGVRDESELRGHRRTYIGARPGRLVEGIRRAGTANPVVLLDEIDKMGSGTWGDPAAALLEILDPEQNHHFVDRYLEVPFDLSEVLFVATANDLGRIPRALRDRMAVLDLPGYSRDDKLVIAENHLLAIAAKNAGLEPDAVSLDDGVLPEMIAGWTREAGVRELQRVLGKLYRAAAVRVARGKEGTLHVRLADLPELLGRRRHVDSEPESTKVPGIARGLAWTPVGGEILYVEASTLPGRGSLVLTGQLGDVMKESARAALTYVLAHSESLGIPLDALAERDVHIHVPAGGVPKDGPSAGVTMFTTLASLLSGRAVRDDVAMTGEATLRGRVLPVGGIEAKVLAAHRHGLKRVILPSANRRDAAELPESVRSELDLVFVDHMSEALEAALVPLSAATPGDRQAA